MKRIKAEKTGGAITVALAGNPNVGKSTLFNALTGMNQHTGNWPGKTVSNAVGGFTHEGKRVRLVDLPGTYSLVSHSDEERIARDYICFGDADATIIICDATAIERSLGLALQILECTDRAVVCVNLIDEAKKKNISFSSDALSKGLGVPVVAVCAANGAGIKQLCDKTVETALGKSCDKPAAIEYDSRCEGALSALDAIARESGLRHDRLYLLKLLLGDLSYLNEANKSCETDKTVFSVVYEKRNRLVASLYADEQELSDSVAEKIAERAGQLSRECCFERNRNDSLDRRLDRLFTGKYTAVPFMLLLLVALLYITIRAANYPSELLSRVLFSFGEIMRGSLVNIGAPQVIISALIDGIWRVLAWVVAVMFPPMAVFFPLFTLLEDFGYLPRVAFNLDSTMKSCGACGKQSLCMAMGLGCNAVGVTGCRIIDSPRERLLAITTNSFVPCNGRFPTLTAIIAMFFVSRIPGAAGTLAGAVILAAVIIASILFCMCATRLLSSTLLKGKASSFTLELPSYRKPKILEVLVRSILDRTLFVLGRAVTVAAPAGLVIWLAANIYIGDCSIIELVSDFLDPLGRLMGMDGVILMAFIMGFPANEIVFPIAVMIYMSQGTVSELPDLTFLHTLLTENGWTSVTAVCVLLFSLMHWPCSTTCMTIKKETGKIRWVLVSVALPTAFGFLACCTVNLISKLFT